MSAVRRRLDDRFAHPRLAALAIAGAALLAVGGLAWLVAPTGSPLQATAFRLLVVGYLLALAGGTGYLAFLAFEFRDRTLR